MLVAFHSTLFLLLLLHCSLTQLHGMAENYLCNSQKAKNKIKNMNIKNLEYRGINNDNRNYF